MDNKTPLVLAIAGLGLIVIGATAGGFSLIAIVAICVLMEIRNEIHEWRMKEVGE